MHKTLQSQASSQNTLLESRETLSTRKSTLTDLSLALAAQRRRICLDLQNIYPIEPVDDDPLTFRIRGVRLPSSGRFEGPEEEVASALGWTAHFVWLLAGYLGVPLRYPVSPVGGRSLIRDPVSIMMGSRTYNPHNQPYNDINIVDSRYMLPVAINIVSITRYSSSTRILSRYIGYKL